MPVWSKDDCHEPLTKRAFRGAVVWIIHGFTLTLCLAVSWLLKKTLFFFNINKDIVDGRIVDVEDIALEEDFFTTTKLTMMSIYIGCSVMASLVNFVYYNVGHPSSVAREKNVEIPK